MLIDRLNTPTIRKRSAPSAASPPAEGFSELVETQQEEAPQAVVQTQAPAAPAPLPELPMRADIRDREARRHGGAMLRALGDLQLAMLGGGGGQALRDLSTLANEAPEAADPALDEVLRAIAQRAAIELARAERSQ